MSAGLQETLAFAIVALAVGVLLLGFLRKTVAEPFSRWLLKRGQVKWAMRIYPKFHKKKPPSGSSCCD
ncbi:MAG: hypothetical protein NDJ90_01895 [Oligoflexia bacterium]|nr:hypothetical protein [Oligoflexia bacterium]